VRSRIRPPQVRRHWIIRGLRLLLAALSARGPLVLLLEDLHWSDASSIEVVGEALADVPGLRVLALASQRPGWSAPWSAWGWTERLTLHTLGAEDATQVAQAVVGGTPLAPDLERHVAERAHDLDLAGEIALIGVELGPHGVRVLNIAPGAVATPINSSTMADPGKLGTLDAAIPLGRIARPEEIARGVVILAYGNAAYMPATTEVLPLLPN